MTIRLTCSKHWKIQPIVLGLLATATIACEPSSVTGGVSPLGSSATSQPDSAKPASPTPVAQPGATYRNDRFRFQFNYLPDQFVVVNDAKVRNTSSNAPVAAVDIWTQKHAQAIRSGAYEKGTEYPANVRVTVFRNAQRLPLQKWVQQQTNWFVMPRNFKDTPVAGRTAIAFESSGLYENEHVVVASPNGTDVIDINLSKINYGDQDVVYRRAFDQVINSFKFTDNQSSNAK